MSMKYGKEKGMEKCISHGYSVLPKNLINFAENFSYMNGRNTDKNLEARLLSGRSVTVVSALEEIKVRGNVAYLPLLFDILNSDPDEQVEKEILKILGTLKIQDAVPVMAEALQSSRYQAIRKQLATACWQNGLDFKNYLPVFVDLVINEEWETGFEAFTVIENLEKLPEKEIIDISAAKIEHAMPNASDKKRYFLQEILILIC